MSDQSPNVALALHDAAMRMRETVASLNLSIGEEVGLRCSELTSHIARSRA